MSVSSPELTYPTRRSMRRAREAEFVVLDAPLAVESPVRVSAAAPPRITRATQPSEIRALPTRRSLRSHGALHHPTIAAAIIETAARDAARLPTFGLDAAGLDDAIDAYSPSHIAAGLGEGGLVDAATRSTPAAPGASPQPGPYPGEPGNVFADQVLDGGHLDAAIDTDGRGFPAVPSGELDWLAPGEAEPLAEASPQPDRQTVRVWLATVRNSVAGVDLRSSAVRRVLPQVGVVAVMAAATVGNALAGQFTPTSTIGGAQVDVARAQTAILPDTEAAPAASDLDSTSDLVAGEDGLLRVRGTADASRGGPRDALPGCDGVPPEVPTTNGDVPERYLCELPGGEYKLRADAAVAFALMDQAYAARFGTGICLSSGYRSYAEQAALRRQKPGLAAPAGGSEHGLGLAVDLCGGVQNEGEGYWWLRENGPSFGFDNPAWARKGGSKYEPWHWEYVAGQW